MIFFNLEQLVDMITNERATLICLSLYVKHIQAFFKAAIVWALSVVVLLFEGRLYVF